MIIGLIPSRLNSTRIPRKPLIEIDGLPLVVHTYKRAKLALGLDDVVVCTDSEEILNIVKKHGGKAALTSPKHINGTERIAEYASNLKPKFVIDIQGDEPLVNPKDIDLVINFHLDNPKFDIVVPSHPTQEAKSKHIVKVVSDRNGKVLYFSRAEIPFEFSNKPEFYSKHLSIISFIPDILQNFSKLKQSNLESIEGVELLRALENNMKIGTFNIYADSFPVDVKEDLKKAIEVMPNDPIRKLY